MSSTDFEFVSSARDRFARSGLILPPIPAAFAARIREFEDPMMWSTRAVAHDLYGFRAAVSEAESADASDYVAFGHAGHGVNSLAVSYYLVHGPLKILLQIPWGGVYMDTDQATKDVIRAFQHAGALIAEFDELADHDVSVSVFASGFYGGRSSMDGPINSAIGASIGSLLQLLTRSALS